MNTKHPELLAAAIVFHAKGMSPDTAVEAAIGQLYRKRCRVSDRAKEAQTLNEKILYQRAAALLEEERRDCRADYFKLVDCVKAAAVQI